MKQESLQLSETELFLVQRSSDLDISRRRLRVVIISGVLLIAALIVVAPLVQSWQFLLFFAVAYIAMSVWERVGYARTILAYKGLIQKLSKRIDDLEGGDEILNT
jgi:hypothetical protein